MKRIIIHSVTTWLLLFLSSTMLMAALPDDDFNPVNPPDPMMKYEVEVAYSEYGYTSGGGTYNWGDEAYISTSANNENYQFAYWLKNGVKYSEESSFIYKVEEWNVKFEAVYDYKPVSPSEPQPMNRYRLYLTTDDEGNCSFNRTSGEKVEAGSFVWLSAYLSSGYIFKGWYLGDELISTDQDFQYEMPKQNVTLRAHIVYSPSSPNDPGGTGQGNVDNSSGIDEVTLSPSACSNRIYQLDGTSAAQLQKGKVYIRNHKKFIAR